MVLPFHRMTRERRDRFNRFAILEQANDVVNRNSGAFYDGIATPHPRRADDVTISFRDRSHNLMLRFAPRSVNAGQDCGRHFERVAGRPGLVSTIYRTIL